MSKFLGKHIISFLVFTLVQVIFCLNFNLYEYGFAFIYIGFIIFLPIETSVIVALVLAFLQGLVVDLFYNTLGIHMFAATLMAYCRMPLINMLLPRLIDSNTELQGLSQLGFQRIVLLTLLLCFLHHSVLLLIINPGWEFFMSNMIKIILSTIISSFIILLFKRIFFNSL